MEAGVAAGALAGGSGTIAALTLQVSFLAVLGFGARGSRPTRSRCRPSSRSCSSCCTSASRITSLVSAYGQYQAATAAAVRVEEVLALDAESFDLPAPSVRTALPRSLSRARTVAYRRPIPISRGPGSKPGPALLPPRSGGIAPGLTAVDFEDVVFSYSEFTPGYTRE